MRCLSTLSACSDCRRPVFALCSFSQVPYEKGRFFLGFLEARVGRPRLDAFLREYFDHFAFQSVTTQD